MIFSFSPYPQKIITTCKECGREIISGSNICKYCGRPAITEYFTHDIVSKFLTFLLVAGCVVCFMFLKG